MAARAYLDWNATTPVLPAVQAVVVEAMALTGNPSSIHAEGRAARAIVERARGDVARLVGAQAGNVVFTSGASEALNAVLRDGLCATCGTHRARLERVLIGATEHACVSAAAPDAEVIPVDANGVISLAALGAMLAAGGPALVAVQLANSESGIIQPIREIAALVHGAGGALLVDAVQGPGKASVDIAALGADVLVLSAHKFGGLAGVGALVFADGETRLERALVAGGGQEGGQRGGTPNLAGIAGMGAAARAALDVDFAAMEALRDRFEAGLRALSVDVLIVGEGAARLPNTSFFALPGIEAAKAMIASDLDGIALSNGSACASGKVKPSAVLAAMGLDALAPHGALRVSIGPMTPWEQLETCLSSLSRQMARIKRPSAA